MLFLVLIGCSPPSSGVGEPAASSSVGEAERDSGESTMTTAPAWSASCIQSPGHPLVARCTTVDLGAAEVMITLASPGVATRERAVAVEGVMDVAWLQADTTYAWTVAAGAEVRTGELTTGSLPADLGAVLNQEGDPLAERVLTSIPCDGVDAGRSRVVVVDTEPLGVTWYGEVGEDDDPMQVRWTADGTIAVVSFRSRVKEWSPEGEVLADFVSARPTLHHDLDIADGRIAALWLEHTDEPGLGRIDQGFVVFDREGVELSRFDFGDVLTPPEGAHDWLHANSIAWLPGGDVLISLRHRSAVARISGHPDAEDFGAVRWWLTGEPDDVVDSDFVLRGLDGGVADFRQQHDAQLLEDGSLLLFDNRNRTTWSPLSEASRGLQLTLDAVAGEARVLRSWPLDRHCPFAGSTQRSADGAVLATCAPSWQVSGFAAGAEEPEWSMTVACEGSTGWTKRVTPLPR